MNHSIESDNSTNNSLELAQHDSPLVNMAKQYDGSEITPLNPESFVEIADFLKDHFPDQVEATVEEEVIFLDVAKDRDIAIEAEGVRSMLEMQGVPAEKIKDLGDGLWSIGFKESMKEDLPDVYAFKGGAARYYLRQAMGLISDDPRDYDVVRLADKEANDGADADVAKFFMPKDFEFGDGVEVVSDLQSYFRTRDLTINEVLATKNGILVTEGAILDTVRNIIRLTSYERWAYSSDGMAGPKMLAKVLRFYSEAIQVGNNAPSIRDIGHNQIEDAFIPPFWIAVNLDRAYERGRNYAAEYTNVLVNNNQLPLDVETPEDAINYLLSVLGDDGFIFRSAPTEDYAAEDDRVNSAVENVQNMHDVNIQKIKRGVVKR